MMTTGSEQEHAQSSKDAIEAWQDTVIVAREERRQRGERYTGRHRPAPPDHADGRVAAIYAGDGLNPPTPDAGSGSADSQRGAARPFEPTQPP
jgi:hypothetical protein